MYIVDNENVDDIKKRVYGMGRENDWKKYEYQCNIKAILTNKNKTNMTYMIITDDNTDLLSEFEKSYKKCIKKSNGKTFFKVNVNNVKKSSDNAENYSIIIKKHHEIRNDGVIKKEYYVSNLQ